MIFFRLCLIFLTMGSMSAEEMFGVHLVFRPGLQGEKLGAIIEAKGPAGDVIPYFSNALLGVENLRLVAEKKDQFGDSMFTFHIANTHENKELKSQLVAGNDLVVIFNDTIVCRPRIIMAIESAIVFGPIRGEKAVGIKNLFSKNNEMDM